MWPEVFGRGPCQPAYGGDKRDRTADPLLAKQVLSQLSYTPKSRRGVTLKIKHQWGRVNPLGSVIADC